MRAGRYIGYVLFTCRFLCLFTCTPPPFDNVTVQDNFDLNRFLGIWFEIKWLPAEPHSESEIWRNFFQSYQMSNWQTKQLFAYGRARVLNDVDCFSIEPWLILANNSARMILQTKALTSSNALNWPYYVMKTDYDHYALIYSCTDNHYSSTQSCINSTFWVFSRTTSLPNIYMNELDAIIENQLCINRTAIEITPHDGRQCYSSLSSNKSDSNWILLLLFVLFLYV